MDNIKNDKYYVLKALENIKIIQKYISNKTYDDFSNDDELIDAIMFRLIQLIENVKSFRIVLKNKIAIYLGVKLLGLEMA